MLTTHLTMYTPTPPIRLHDIALFNLGQINLCFTLALLVDRDSEVGKIPDYGLGGWNYIF
jgi:hypothetical protein